MPLAPTGNPPIKLKKIVVPQLPGRLNKSLVIFSKGFLRRKQIPLLTVKDEINIKGNRDGTSTSAQNIIPFFAPKEAFFGKINIIRLTQSAKTA